MNEKQPCVYILASKRNGTLYVGITNDLVQRVYQHKHHIIGGFTQKYKVYSLVYYELHAVMDVALTRKKRIKHWRRQWKINLIEQTNKEWKDLYDDLVS